MSCIEKEIRESIEMLKKINNEAEYMVYSKNTCSYGRSQYYLNGRRWGDLLAKDINNDVIGIPREFKKDKALFDTNKGCMELTEMVQRMNTEMKTGYIVKSFCNPDGTKNAVDRIFITSPQIEVMKTHPEFMTT